MSDRFVSIFKRDDDLKRLRGNFLSRLFGTLSEEVVNVWASDRRAPYANEGRPTIRLPSYDKGRTLDFTLRCRTTNKAYVTELKCEIAYEGYKYLTLDDVSQLDHHKKPAFGALLDAAANHREMQTRVNKRAIEISGAILIWGVVTDQGRKAVREKYGFADVLSIAEMIQQLQEWRSVEYRELIQRLRGWSNEMYDGLLGAEDAQ